MISASEVKDLAIGLGAEICGIANVERFIESPKGFHPTDIYKDCKSVIVYIKSLPSEIIAANNLVPYTHSSSIIFSELDKIGLELCRILENKGVKAVPTPSDTPYEYWDAERMHGMGILSMRHAGYLAGLGILGKNTLLINRKLGNMIYIGAILANLEVEPDPIVNDFACPTNCSVCIDSCPEKALDGLTVNQIKCRKSSIATTGRGFHIYKCNKCRRNCLLKSGAK